MGTARNYEAWSGTSGGSVSLTPDFDAPAKVWLFQNTSSTATDVITFTLVGQDIKVRGGQTLKIALVADSVAVAGSGAGYVVRAADVPSSLDVSIESAGSGGGGSSTPTQEYLSSATVAISAMVDTVLIQKSGAPCTVTLPAITAALDGNITSIKMEVADVAGAAGTHTITIQPNAGDTGTLINGAANATITSNYGSVTLQAVNYDGITYTGSHDESRSGKHWKLS